MSTQFGDVPFLDPETGRFPDDFAPPSVAADKAAAQDAAQEAANARGDAEGFSATAGTLAGQASTAAGEAMDARDETLTARDGAVTARNGAQTAAQEAGDHADRAEQAAQEATAPTDEMVAEKINDPASLTGAALSAAIGESMQDFGASDAVQSFLSIIENGVRDAHLLLIGDSTGNEPTEWAHLFFQDLAALHPSHAFHYRLWNEASSSYDAAVVVGSGTRTVTLWNASVAGWGTTHFQDERGSAAVYSVPADLVLISLGHNEQNLNRDAWRSRYLSLTESITARKQETPLVLIGQNPATANTFQAQRIEVYKEIASRQGYGFIDVHAAFVKDGRDLTSDGIHPNSIGSRLWSDVVVAAFTRTKAEPRTRPASMLLRRSAENDAPNGALTDWAGSTPTGWVVSSAATSAKASTGFETGDSAWTLTSSGANASAYLPLDVEKVKGKTYTLAVRAKVAPGSDPAATGRIGIYDNTGSDLQIAGSYPTDGYRWLIHTGSFDPASATARIYIYAGNTAGSSITIDRLVLVEGLYPTDAAQVAVPSSGGTGTPQSAWSTPAGLAPTASVTVGSLRIKREGSLVFCQIINMAIPAGSAPFVVANVPTGYRSTAGPTGQVASMITQVSATGDLNPKFQQLMAIFGTDIRWSGAVDTTTGAFLASPARIDGVLIWHTEDPIPS